MKQILTIAVALLTVSTAFSQAGQKWSTSGNTNSTGDFIGSSNNEPLIFKTNNSTRGLFTSTGDFRLVNLKGTAPGVRLLKTDLDGSISSFTMGTSNDVLYGDGIWRPLPIPNPTFWEINGTSLYYLNGKVGIGTKTPFTNFDVIGDAYISNNLYVGGGIIITEKVNANVEVVTTALKADAIYLDSAKAVHGYSIFKDEVKLENKLQVVGNTQIDGNLRLNGELSFGNNKRFGYLPASNGVGEVISFGGYPLPPSIDPCFSPTVTSNQFQGMIQAYGNSAYGGGTNILSMGFDGANGIIDMAGVNTQGGPGLLINYYCGKNVAINTGIKGGNVFLTSPTMGMVGIGTGTPTAKLDVLGTGKFSSNVAVGSSINTHVQLLVKPSDPANIGMCVETPSIADYNYSFKSVLSNPKAKAIAVTAPAAAEDKFVVWGDGTVNIRTDFTQSIKSLSVTDNNSGKDVFRIMSNGHVFATELTIKLKDDFPDYVFAKNYQLMSLSDLNTFIENNNHLPNIPNAKEVKENGLSLGEMQVKQMEKIEELTLYILELNKRLSALEQENKSLKESN